MASREPPDDRPPLPRPSDLLGARGLRAVGAVMTWLLIITFYSAYSGRVPLKIGPFQSAAACQAVAVQAERSLNPHGTIREMACFEVPRGVN